MRKLKPLFTKTVLCIPARVLAIPATLLMSFGVNLLSGLSIWSAEPPGLYDLVAVLFALSSIMIGAVALLLMPEAEDLARYVDELAKQPLSEEQRKAKKGDRVMKRFSQISVKSAEIMLRTAAIVTLVAFLLLAGSALNACRKEVKEPVGERESDSSKSPCVIGYQEIALYRHVFVAKAKGYFEEEGVNVDLKPFASANQMVQAMVAGQLDVTGLSNLEVALSVEGKSPGLFKMVNFLVWKEKSFPDYILARKDSGIASLKDFEGKTMGLHPGSAVQMFSRAVLEKSGVDVSKVQFFELKPTTMQDAVVAKRVDGVYCMDPVATSLLDIGACTVILSNPMQEIFPAPVPISGTAISKKLIENDPKAARGIARALERAIEYMREPGHEQEVAECIAKYTPVSKELALKMNTSEYWTLKEIDRGQVQKLADRFAELGIIEQRIDVTNLIVPADFLTVGN